MSDHGIDKAKNINTLNPQFVEALQKAWCADTCWGPIRGQYPQDGSNPAFGNCLVSTLAAWADGGFEDDIIPCLFLEPGMTQDGWHFQLETENGTVDPTFQQFKEGVVLQQLPPDHPMHKTVVQGSLFDKAEEASLRQRLALLLDRMSAAGYDIDYTADRIVDHAKEHFAYAAPAAAQTPRPAGP